MIDGDCATYWADSGFEWINGARVRPWMVDLKPYQGRPTRPLSTRPMVFVGLSEPPPEIVEEEEPE
jgi:hypothetical protein